MPTVSTLYFPFDLLSFSSSGSSSTGRGSTTRPSASRRFLRRRRGTVILTSTLLLGTVRDWIGGCMGSSGRKRSIRPELPFVDASCGLLTFSVGFTRVWGRGGGGKKEGGREERYLDKGLFAAERRDPFVDVLDDGRVLDADYALVGDRDPWAGRAVAAAVRDVLWGEGHDVALRMQLGCRGWWFGRISI